MSSILVSIVNPDNPKHKVAQFVFACLDRPGTRGIGAKHSQHWQTVTSHETKHPSPAADGILRIPSLVDVSCSSRTIIQTHSGRVFTRRRKFDTKLTMIGSTDTRLARNLERQHTISILGTQNGLYRAFHILMTPRGVAVVVGVLTHYHHHTTPNPCHHCSPST